MTLLRAIWRGEGRLWVTYWLWGVGGNMAFAIALALSILYLQPTLAAAVWLWGLYGVSLVWFIFVFVAIWRSARRYPGPRIWAILARLGTILGIFRMAAEALYLLFLYVV
jgi:hypothetical protein